MIEKQAHTPTPWRSSQMGSEGARILPDYGDIRERTKYIAIVNGRDTVTDFANAEFIVRSVNSHEALVEACIQADLQIEYMQSKFKETGTGNAIRTQLQRVIAEAKKP